MVDRGSAQRGIAAFLIAGAAAVPWSALADDGVSAGVAAAQERVVGLRGYGPRAFGDRPTVGEMTALGAKLFMDPALSASGKLSCASCHSPENAFAAPNRLSTQLGGIDSKAPGRRNPPTLMYLQTSIPFTEHFIDDEDLHGEDAGPTGGLTWDGRVNSPREQALIPLFAGNEMANPSVAALIARLRRSALADEFRRTFSEKGEDVLEHPDRALGWLTSALEVYQQSPGDFYPFTSKYDAVVRGRAQFSAKEARGHELFNDPSKGNCATCHPSSSRSGFALFTDGGYIALGVPRNRDIVANRDPRFFDLGLCGPDRKDLADRSYYCGRFKTPTLRNVATRKSFFHNGQFHDLRKVLEFYATRDADPARWYPRNRDGSVRRFDDLPKRYHGNVNTEAPFAPLAKSKPRLNSQEIDDLLAFLETLTDGYEPPAERRESATALASGEWRTARSASAARDSSGSAGKP
jgi:cytochrome c peroxidase